MNLRVDPFHKPISSLPLSGRAGSAESIESASIAPITVTYGDGIGPEIMASVLQIMEAAGAKLRIEAVDIGQSVFDGGEASGVSSNAWDSFRRTKVLLKAPMAALEGKGLKSPSITLRDSLGLFANLRPCVSYHPYIQAKHPNLNVIIVRENEEDVYTGIEHRQTDEVYQCLKITSRPGCARISRYAFELARQTGRKRVTCFTKDNILTLTDGLFHTVFAEVAKQYPDIESEHWIVDAGAAQLASNPERFDIIVMPNMYGDILSDVAAEAAGSLGIAPSANIGFNYAMFEAVHSSAPALAGKDLANPSAFLLSAVMMLVHIKQQKVAELIHNAWLRTIEDGCHTFDMYSDVGISKREVGTSAFTNTVIANLGELPRDLKRVAYNGAKLEQFSIAKAAVDRPAARNELVGIDVFVHWRGQQTRILAETMRCAEDSNLELIMITNRGVRVWPVAFDEALKTDHWRCRFLARFGRSVTLSEVAELQSKLAYLGVDFIKTEHLYNFNDQPGFSSS